MGNRGERDRPAEDARGVGALTGPQEHEHSYATVTRRRLLELGAAAVAVPVIASCGEDNGAATTSQSGEPASLPPTPAYDDGHPTPSQVEGPFFTPSSPERTVLREADVAGSPLTLAGRVLDTRCEPVAGALLDFWQADGDGVYDNEGYRLRGHQFADARGRYRLETVKPGEYPGRTPHVHVMVQPEAGDVLTTQLYFPGEVANEVDPLFDPALLVASDGRIPRFDFVLAA